LALVLREQLTETGLSISEAEATAQTQSAFRLAPPRFLPRRYKPKNVGEWTGHLTFASELISALRPGLIVELGTHWGEAYFTFCQTVQEQGLDSVCYAVDHWQGDEHAGRYGEEVFEAVSSYNDRFYRQFSYLLRRSFDEALAQFADDSIGLLHIDGLHTYEAVAHDFRNWLPKVKSGGIVLLHDICPRHQDFGVWRLWEEIRAEFSDTFEFHHSWGLGVLRKPGGSDSTALTELLFDSSLATREDVRRHYVTYASHLDRLLGRVPPPPPPPEQTSEVRVEVFPAINGQHSVEVCQIRTMKAGVWNRLCFDLRYADIGGPLRVDPAWEPSLIEVGEIEIHSAETGELIWSLPEGAHQDQLQLRGTALPYRDGSPLIISTGDDPQLWLMIPPEVHGPMKLTINLKVEPATKSLMEVFYGRLQTEVQQRTSAEQTRIEAELGRSSAEQERSAIAARLNATTAELVQTAGARNKAEAALQETSDRLVQVERSLSSIQNSLSWRVTDPMRRMMSALRAGPRKTH
jgi:hypothetical protein